MFQNLLWLLFDSLSTNGYVICQITWGKRSTINDVIFLAKWTKDPAKRGLLNDSLLLLVNTQTQVFWFFREDSRRNIGPWWISIDCCCEEGFVFFSQATPEGSLNRWDLLKEPLRLRLSSVLSTIFIFFLVRSDSFSSTKQTNFGRAMQG